MAEIIVNGSSRLSEAIRDAKAGDTVIIPNGIYDVSVGYDDIAKEGLIVKGQSREGVVIRAKNFEWNRGIFNVVAPSKWSNFTLTTPQFGGQVYFAQYGMLLRASDIELDNVAVENFAEAGLFLFSQQDQFLQNVKLRNIKATNSARETGSWARGNVMIQANLRNALLENFDITHTTAEQINTWGDRRSGYALKFAGFNSGTPNAQIEDSVLRNIKTNGKPLSSFANSIGNISIEGWKAIFSGCELDGLDLNAQLSLPNGNPTTKLTKIKNSKVSTTISTTFECGLSNVEVSDTYFDVSKNDKNWHVIGEFNSTETTVNQKFVRCTFDFGKMDGRLMTYKSPLENIEFVDCTFKGDAGQTIKLLEMRGDKAELRSDVVFRNTKFVGDIKLDTTIEFTEGSTNKLNKGIKLVTDTVVTPKPVDPAPPNPVVEQPEVKRVYEEDPRYPGYLREVTLIKKK